MEDLSVIVCDLELHIKKFNSVQDVKEWKTKIFYFIG
jgi:hypothetical protein